MKNIKIKVLFFGQLAEQCGVNQLELQNLDSTNDVMDNLKLKFEVLKSNNFQMALDKEIIHENISLSGEHTLALLPPYAGG